MKNPNKDEDLFHLFIQYTDKLPPEAQIFPYFEFMDHSIRKHFNQLKKEIKKPKELDAFDEFWHELSNEDRVKLYCNWVVHLRKALEMEKNSSLKLEPESSTIQDQIYIRKVNLFNNWEKKIVRLTPTHLSIEGRKKRDFELKNYEIRKSRGKDAFSWVLKPIINDGKSLHCEVGNQNMFEEWYYALTVNINNQRVESFLNAIKQERAHPGILLQKLSQASNEEKKIGNQKTLTELMIDKQMALRDNEIFTEVDEGEDEFESLEDISEQFDEKQLEEDILSHKVQSINKKAPINPNIFKRLAPEYSAILNFADTPFNSTLLHCDSEYRIYELPHKENGQIILKMFTVLSFPKSLVFEAIVSESKSWNEDIDVVLVKTNISSENSALVYQKDKPQGILYRERDFLFLRHCFSVENMKQKNTFIIDKSIDSIHHPPFMYVVRAEKRLIWGLIEKENEKECILIVEGWLNGGGYMNELQSKEMTIKLMKKILNLKGFLKQLSFSENSKNNLFKENWVVDFNQTESQTAHKTEEQESEKRSGKESESPEKIPIKSDHELKQEQEMEEFMKQTHEETSRNPISENEIIQTDEKLDVLSYKPPAFAADKFVIIPQTYLKLKNIETPKEKEKKPKYFPPVRGHHIWKGEWQINIAGGLGYIDEEKMKEQKKVLTYIIKRIGKNIFSGKGILNISLPVDIFCMESNIERLAMSFGYFPYYLEKAVDIEDPVQQLKYVLGAGIPSSLIYLTMEKPFNPILGETYQCWIDGCPMYFEQISHHPPIAAFILKGRGYTVTGNVEAKMDLSINSGTGNNEGVFVVEFDKGNKWYFTTPAGFLQGLTYGERKLNMVGKSFYWNDQGLFLELNYNPAAKTKGFFSAAKGEGDEKLIDYFEGHIKQFPQSAIKEICFKHSGETLIPIIPKGCPNCEPLEIMNKVYGRWNKYVKFGNDTIYDVDENRYFSISDEKNPLPSHCNYREDIVYRRLKNFILSQEFKELLEDKQRNDRKLRTMFGKTSSH